MLYCKKIAVGVRDYEKIKIIQFSQILIIYLLSADLPSGHHSGNVSSKLC